MSSEAISKIPGPAAAGPERLPGLDLVRAVAIAMVVVAHAKLVHPGEWWPTLAAAAGSVGASGVDVFFALSGYLIGGQIYREMAAGRFSLTAFWRRRWLRTIPAYYAFLAAHYGWSHWIVRHPLTCDWRYLLHVQFFDPSDIPGLIRESWSLAVEEWFYLLLPLLLMAGRAAGLGLRAVFGAAAVAFLAAGLASRIVFLPYLGVTLPLITPVRIDAFAAGILVAAFDRSGGFASARLRGWLAAAGAALFAAVVARVVWELFYREQVSLAMYLLKAPLLPAAAALCLPAAARLKEIARPALARAVRWTARISYSMYLANQLVGWIVNSASSRIALPLPVALALYAAGTWGIAHLSHEWIERPFIAWYRRRDAQARAERRAVATQTP